MKRGLLLGKFMPLHKGHVRLIEFAAERCDELIVLICATKSEPIDGATRIKWVKTIFANDERIRPRLLIYDEDILPNTSVSSEMVSRIWAEYLKVHLDRVDIFFSSEAYGEYMGRYLGCEYVIFDQARLNVPVSSTLIRNDPFKYWDFIPLGVKPYFVKKICIYGSESTGKTTLTQLLASHYQATFVPEMARDILEHTVDCTEQHLAQIAELHASAINSKLAEANRLLFVDTDINITRSYSRFLFGKELKTEPWIDDANRFDFYLYLDIDAPFVQDGTRLDEDQRRLLNESHKAELVNRGIKYEPIQGNWEERFTRAVMILDELIKV